MATFIYYYLLLFDGLGNIRNSHGVDTDIKSYCTMTGTNDCPPEMNPPQIFVERTLAMLKPDVAHRETEIEDAILRAGFTIIQVDFQAHSCTVLWWMLISPSQSIHLIMANM